MNKKPTAIEDVINKWFDTKKLTKRRTNYGAFHGWDEIVGPDIAKNTEPAKFYNSRLVVNVKSSVWMQELQYMKPQLLEKIKASLPETEITDLIFKVGACKKD